MSHILFHVGLPSPAPNLVRQSLAVRLPESPNNTDRPEAPVQAGEGRWLTDPLGSLRLLWAWVQFQPHCRLGVAVLGKPLTSWRVWLFLPPSCCSGGHGWVTLGRPFVPMHVHECRALLRLFSNQTGLILPDRNLFWGKHTPNTVSPPPRPAGTD